MLGKLHHCFSSAPCSKQTRILCCCDHLENCVYAIGVWSTGSLAVTLIVMLPAWVMRVAVSASDNTIDGNLCPMVFSTVWTLCFILRVAFFWSAWLNKEGKYRWALSYVWFFTWGPMIFCISLFSFFIPKMVDQRRFDLKQNLENEEDIMKNQN